MELCTALMLAAGLLSPRGIRGQLLEIPALGIEEFGSKPRGSGLAGGGDGS